MNLQSLINQLHFYTYDSKENPVITSIEMDSREVKPGSLFICIKGYTVDGHDYVQQAIDKGAVAVIAEKPLQVNVPVVLVSDTKRTMAILADFFYEHPTQGLQLIGVTGTNGKTSTTHMIEQIIQAADKKTGLIGTIHTKIGDQVFEAKNTTPESLTLQKTFSQMKQAKVDTAIMEVSSHALDLGRVHGCDFDIAVFTNLTQDHLDYHETMTEYRRVKGLLFAQLGNTFHSDKKKYAILNSDDLASDEYKRSTAAHVITYGIREQSNVMAKDIKMNNSGTYFTLLLGNEVYPVQVKLVGLFNVYNVLAAIAACTAAEIAIETILSTLEKLEGVQGRFELVQAGQEFAVVVDYAHTPDSLENAIKTVKEFAQGTVYTIVGCGGDRDKTKRPLMANIATTYSDVAIFTSDNPRSEDPIQILKDMEAGVKEGSYQTIVSREEAIGVAINAANKGDVILIAGKGHETYQQIGKEVFDFDDREVASRLIKGRLKEC
ncbi:UDP-N-acetylmuramoyl-L-alanyl-D-glutamate--2,6-diaminopimelate ligase [Bacillus mesophilus]|uniref:UDP-N-acetylmuramoyl-L-alanyl-D-glutamate--2,6-diaminopimelate ligase n=1 Tax=Bacillus mesophilus TaxID=1808955 RepID=A0A6M0Q2K3_9BACI|nr:UDP-N-acetylmuramoyl-L-alanyl-D-glutamate--2,6-diaminopimelate ligase [Bacillus mesophilus]MBM7659460.1 UDP-N-acetylmuramoyl-L-alanyl-D-glutamate--2,6-diaminopimelate ligase [Bacillus mesophilus]NEY70333.1 UDP-N-acetylmuramoyl-L-alanyl-D-glutamate--2,6-diaminopimelate ligase [Bacillus mesophilus]